VGNAKGIRRGVNGFAGPQAANPVVNNDDATGALNGGGLKVDESEGEALGSLRADAIGDLV
jgi:hypothetical protein